MNVLIISDVERLGGRGEEGKQDGWLAARRRETLTFLLGFKTLSHNLITFISSSSFCHRHQPASQPTTTQQSHISLVCTVKPHVSEFLRISFFQPFFPAFEEESQSPSNASPSHESSKGSLFAFSSIANNRSHPTPIVNHYII